MPGRPWTLLPTPGAERHQGVFAPFSRLYGSRRRAGTDVFFMQKEEEKMKKRVISLLLALVLALGLLPTAAWAAGTKPRRGSGTEADPYLIGTAEELEWFRDHVNGDENGASHRTDCAKLTNDITLGSWTPFAPGDGDIRNAFGGTFDGNNHIIKNLTVTNGDGLFASVCGATIKNLKVEGTVSNNDSTGVGGIVGKTQGKVTIKNCAFSGNVSSENKKRSAGVGGIVGIVNKGTLQLENCYSTADVR